MLDRKPFYVTTPIYYVNDRPHIGHAYTTLACDVLARFKRLDGFDVRFLTGTDEHGQKVEKSAAAAGVSPPAFTDRISGDFRALNARLGVAPDDFIRTTEPRHVGAVRALWRRLRDKNAFYLGTYAGWYAVRDEAFYSATEVVDDGAGGKVAIASGAPVTWVEEPSYFFRLSDWGDRLLRFYNDNPDFIAPASRRNEVIRFVEGGLKDLSISRTTFHWGVPTPDDDRHIVYVWLDALTNYIAALGYPDDRNGDFARFWPADLHLVGKDILRFHAVYWPAFLMAADLPLPRRIFAHGWWTNDGAKISKSVGNVIDPLDLIERLGLDPVRYFLLRETPFGDDGDFSESALSMRNDHDLANDFGNLAQRTLTLIQGRCDGRVPNPGPFLDADAALREIADAALPLVRARLDAQAFHRALKEIQAVTTAANRYIDAQAPWALRKTDPARMATILYVLAEVLRRLGLLALPFMPGSGARLLDQLAVPESARQYSAWDRAMTPGTTLPSPTVLFPRLGATAQRP